MHVHVGVYICVCVCVCVYVGNEEEFNSVLLKNFDNHESTDITATSFDDEKKVAEGHQSSPIEDSFVVESQTPPKCSPVLRNKVSLYC